MILGEELIFLKEKIKEELKQSLKNRDEISLSVLRMLSAAILNKEKEKRTKIAKAEPNLTENELSQKSQLQDEEIIEVISSEAKKRKEAILEYEKGKREELAQIEKKELEVLKKYLPEQLPEEEIKKLVKEAIEKTGAKEQKDIGKLMAELMPKVKGKADGSQVSRIVKEMLMVEI